MKMKCHDQININSFLGQYINGDPSVMEFFDYPLNDEGLQARLREVSSRIYLREQLVEALQHFNEKFTDSNATFKQIHRLKDSRSVVVVGGQQAGLLTGPLYTVNKIISVLHEANIMEKKLAVPVVPIFWIAGEDHDIDEVNHTFFYHGDQTSKVKIKERNDTKQPVSERMISSDEGKVLVKQAFQYIEETEYTKELYNELINDLNGDKTYVEWFALIIHRLFKDSGLVLMDAADPNIRDMERGFFGQMIERNDAMREAFIQGAESMKHAGFGEPITIDKRNAHLFIHVQGQRSLLEKEGSLFYEKNGAGSWSESELMDKLKDEDNHPFSNNVVTRPLMQDMLLPVMAFIAGPGELKYWGTLRKVFHTFEINMPLVYPRVHITFLSRKTEKSLEWIGTEPHNVSENGLQENKQQWLVNNTPINVEDVFAGVTEKVEKALSQLSEELVPIGEGVKPINNRYHGMIMRELERYKNKVDTFMLAEQSSLLKRFAYAETEIKPDNQLQERYLNIFPFLNQYGDDLLLRTLQLVKREDTLIGKNLYIYL